MAELVATYMTTSCATHWHPEAPVRRARGIVLIYDSNRKTQKVLSWTLPWPQGPVRIAAASERITETRVQAWVGVGGVAY